MLKHGGATQPAQAVSITPAAAPAAANSLAEAWLDLSGGNLGGGHVYSQARVPVRTAVAAMINAREPR